MDFGKMVIDLMAAGYTRASAQAKIAHDVVLAAINYLRRYVYDEKKMLERTPESIVARLKTVFDDALFKRQLRNKKFAWVDAPPSVVTQRIVDLINSLAGR